jgi:hypothetical protein
MRKVIIGLMLAGSLAVGGAAYGQELIVTASRISEYDATSTPHVFLRKRADNLIVEVNVVCDTRDMSQRRDELRTTLKSLMRAAEKDPTIELGIGEEIVGRFDETMIDSLIGPSKRPDTSAAKLLIKTRVTPADTQDSATGRIEAFIEKAPKAGRTEVLVAKDSLASAGAFGADYGVSVQGLQLPVSWYQVGPLDLALYIPYRLEVRNK